jgi:SAM-dependent methyltransferase
VTIVHSDHAFVRENGRLALYKRAATQAYWEDGLSALSDARLRHTLRHSKQLYSHSAFFKRWIPANGIVLEAGCGAGMWVKRLRAHGWNCIGIDYAMNGLSRSKHISPLLPLIAGNVFSLPFADNSIASYLSFGVIEHFPTNAVDVLRECKRVLVPGGTALISVPYDNLIRQHQTTMTAEQAASVGLEFYQYYFTDVTHQHPHPKSLSLRARDLMPLLEFAPLLPEGEGAGG